MSPDHGVLLVNLGTPDSPRAGDVRRYLRQLLSDRRVVDLPRAVWWPILYLFVLPFRPRIMARAYKHIWTEEGSPLLVYTLRLAAALQDALQPAAGAVPVAVGMVCGNPSIAAGLDALRDGGCRRIVVLPLYPQYAGSTTGSAFDAVAGVLGRWQVVPELRRVSGYHDHPDYIEALAARVHDEWQRNGEPERLLISFHGLPQRYVDAGDPYREQCETTAQLLAERLQLDSRRWKLAFQSRFGREAWLQPYTDATLREWGREKLASVDVVCPGFAADCLETLEEIDVWNRDIFRSAGGGRFRYLPALNDSPEHVRLLATLVRQHAALRADTTAIQQ